MVWGPDGVGQFGVPAIGLASVGPSAEQEDLPERGMPVGRDSGSDAVALGAADTGLVEV